MWLKERCCRLTAGGKPVLFTPSSHAATALSVHIQHCVFFAFIYGIWRVAGENIHLKLPHYQPISSAFPLNWSISLTGDLWSIFHQLPHLQTSSEVPLRRRGVCMCIIACFTHFICPTIQIFTLFFWQFGNYFLSSSVEIVPNLPASDPILPLNDD